MDSESDLSCESNNGLNPGQGQGEAHASEGENKKDVYKKLTATEAEIFYKNGTTKSASDVTEGGDGEGGEGVSSCSTTNSGTDYSDYDQDQEEEVDSEYDEGLSCNVCDRSFPTSRKLATHQYTKRHFGCSVCDALFPSLMGLKHHKESLEHWSDGEGPGNEDKESEEEEGFLPNRCEELERLL